MKRFAYPQLFTRIILVCCIFAVFFFAADTVFAQTVGGVAGQGDDFGLSEVEGNINLSSTSIILIITRIIRVVLGLIGIMVLVLILYAGFMWMTSQGQEEKIQKAKQTLVSAVIGLAIIMSAFAIVQFIISALSDATGVTNGGNNGNSGDLIITSFAGSGALGTAILDHYPFRSQTDVPRNTKISITFREAVAPSSIIINTNNTCSNAAGESGQCAAEEFVTPIYGDCIEDAVDFDWERDCDAINTSSIQITERDGENPVIVEGAIMVNYEDAAKTKMKTITIRPYDYLGSAIEKIWYKVQLTNNIVNTENESIFRNNRSPYYWSFQTDTILDTSPPVITSIYPENNGGISKNTIIQINFDEAMDPVAVQGILNTDNNPFTNLIFNNTDIQGQWQISNAYRTVEFIPDEVCAEVNSCGETMYCLPVPGCTGDDVTCSSEYQALVRTAALIASTESWEAFPFTGVSDISGNALDGKPQVTDGTVITEISDQEIGLTGLDNFSWDFTVINDLDRRIPYPHQISPEVDAQEVTGNVPVTIQFSIPMYGRTLYGLTITEYPVTDYGLVWTRPQFDMVDLPIFGENAVGSKATIDHREFRPDNRKDLFYMPTIPGGVKGINQNCLYPGIGPDDTTCTYDAENGSTGCVPVTMEQESDTGCGYNAIAGTGGQAVASTEECLTNIKNDIDTYLLNEENK